ncbi:MAG TPA: FlgD immunoglobulin-like domain containing protein [Gaiellaceae bacterium]|nr:FlgD immunoglobulin-like domain containing protein [Gaiellaceae bacterium]
MARLLPTLLVLSLIGSTAVAFAVTEGLKLEKSPVTGTQVDKVVAAGCRCANDRVAIGFTLRKGDRVSVAVVNVDNQVVRTLARSQRARAGTLQFVWNGRDQAGQVVPDGTYRPRVHLAREHRTIVLPNPIRADSTRPLIKLVSVAPKTFSPDGDYRREYVRLRYRTNERARAILYVNGDRWGMVHDYLRAGKLDWGGKAVRRLPARTYRVRLRALDLAGNLGRPTRAFVVRIRYIEALPHVVRVRSGARFSVHVVTDAVRYTWHIGSRGKVARRPVLRIRAGAPGRYVLRIAANAHVARVLVLVRPAS